jgi:hypothetical protein
MARPLVLQTFQQLWLDLATDKQADSRPIQAGSATDYSFHRQELTNQVALSQTATFRGQSWIFSWCLLCFCQGTQFR